MGERPRSVSYSLYKPRKLPYKPRKRMTTIAKLLRTALLSAALTLPLSCAWAGTSAALTLPRSCAWAGTSAGTNASAEVATLGATPPLQKALGAFAAKIKSGVSLDFTSSAQESTGAQEENFSGRIWLKGQLFRIFFSGIDAAYDGRYLSSIDSNQKTYTVATPTRQDLLLLSPLTLLQNPDAHFNISVLNAPAGEYAYKATPKGSEFAGVEYFEVHLKASDGMPTLLKLKASGQDFISYRVSSVKDRPTLNAYDFTYTTRQTQGLEFIDLR